MSSSSNSASHSETVSCYHDPLGSHIIALRKYLYQMQLTRDGRQKDSKKRELPQFPEYFSHDLMKSSTKGNVMVKFEEGSFNKKAIKEQIEIFITAILAQVGYHEWSSPIVSILCADVVEFLKKITKVLKVNSRAFTGMDNNLLNALETTLHEIGYGGIHGLHEFYYQNVVKKHDVLLKQCAIETTVQKEKEFLTRHKCDRRTR